MFHRFNVYCYYGWFCAINGKALKVKFSDSVDTEKAEITVKKGIVNVNVADVKFAEDKKSAEIELSTKLTKGEYTVCVAGLTEEDLTGSVAVENEVASKIELVGTTAANGSGTATIGYKVLNQYGEDITKAAPTITWTASNGTAGGNATTGVVTLIGTYKAGEVVTLTGIISSLGVVVSEKVTIGEVATVGEVEFKGIYHADDKELYTDSDYTQFALLLEAKDQYGNKLAVTDINNATLITSSDESVLKLSTAGVTANNGADSDELGITFVAPSTPKEGTATIRIISKTTGQIFSYDVTVKKAATVDTITLSQPAVVVAAGEKVEIPFAAVDQYGKEVTKFADLDGVVTLSNTGSANPADFAFRNDYVNKKAVLEFTAPSTEGSYILMAVTPSGKTSQITVEVKEAATPAVISKVKDVKTSLSVGATTDVTVKNFVVLDQYGREVKLNSTFFTNYKITLEASDGTADKVTGFADITAATSTGSSVTLTGAAKGAEKVKATIFKTSDSTAIVGSEIEFNITVIESDAVADYEVADIPTLYDDSNTDYAVELDVYGVKSGGSKVAIPSTQYTVISNLTGVTENGGKLHANGVSIPAGKTEVTGTITIIVDGADGPVTITKDITVTNIAPKVVKISNITAGDITFKNGVASGSATDINVTNLLATFVYEDQYGVEVTKTPNVTFTNLVDANDDNSLIITDNGTTSAAITGVEAGDTFNMTIVVDGLTKTIKVVAE
ncbi:hypothetical protein AAK964_00855 [Tissierella praeacuta]|uniref:hypothetical protein n=1 Tax=Tissierella praeacuta TaxID=43131 RepID=UPI003512A27F